MGSCFSTVTTTATDAVNLPPTAKVITIRGALREYSTPVAASDVLGSDSPACSLCSSDRLYCDEYIPALDPEELLQPGQIYFVLPATKLRFPLSGEDMAALAVKASAALGMLSERGGRRSKRVRVTPVPDMEGGWDGSGGVDGRVKRSEEKVHPVAAPPAVVQRKKMKRSASVRARVAYRYSRPRLSAIPEIVE